MLSNLNDLYTCNYCGDPKKENSTMCGECADLPRWREAIEAHKKRQAKQQHPAGGKNGTKNKNS